MSEWLPLWEYDVVSRTNYHLTVCWIAIGVVVAIALFGRRRVNFASLVPAIVFAGLTLLYVRMVAGFSFVLVPLLARAIRVAAERLAGGSDGRMRVIRVGAWAFVLAFCLLAARRGPAGTLTLSPGADFYPVGIVRELKQEGFRGNLFNSLEWGGYLAWELRGSRVFMDTRTGTFLYPAELSRDWERIKDVTGDWRETLARYPIDLVVVRPWEGLGERLAAEPGWVRVAEDASGVCYRRSAPVSADRAGGS
jgi:hypothetical protein